MTKRRRLRVQEALRSWGAALEKSIIGHRVDPPPIPKGGELDVLRLWTRERDGVTGRAAGRLAAMAVAAELDRVAVDAVRSKHEAERLAGVEACGRLGIGEVGDDLVRLLRSGRAPMWERAGVALVRLAPAEALDLLFPLIGGDVPAAAPGLARVLGAAPEPVRGAAVSAALFDLAPVPQSALTRALGRVPTPSALPAVRRVLRLLDVDDPANDDVVAGCVAALGAAGDASDAVRVRLLAAHRAWPVRMECAVALGALDGDAATLRTLAEDVEWLVRRAAADALGTPDPAVAREVHQMLLTRRGSEGGLHEEAAEALPGEGEADDRLGVDDVAASDESGYVVEGHALDGHVAFLDRRGAGVALGEVASQVDERVLVAEPWRVVELGE